MKYIYSFFFISALSIFAFAEKNIKPTINLSPIWVLSDGYGTYWGASISGGVILKQHHTLIATADLAPWGGISITDVATNGKDNHFGGTVAYQYKFRIANNFLKISPGIVTGVSTIPYVYGTMPSPSDTTSSTLDEPKPDRETVWGIGPDLSVELGRKKINFFARGRLLFAKKENIVLLTNIGISFSL